MGRVKPQCNINCKTQPVYKTSNFKGVDKFETLVCNMLQFRFIRVFLCALVVSVFNILKKQSRNNTKRGSVLNLWCKDFRIITVLVDLCVLCGFAFFAALREIISRKAAKDAKKHKFSFNHCFRTLREKTRNKSNLTCCSIFCYSILLLYG